MIKFYVNSGRLACVIARESAKEAALAAMQRDIKLGGDPDEYGNLIEVNESGHELNYKEGMFFPTNSLLRMIV